MQLCDMDGEVSCSRSRPCCAVGEGLPGCGDLALIGSYVASCWIFPQEYGSPLSNSRRKRVSLCVAYVGLQWSKGQRGYSRPLWQGEMGINFTYLQAGNKSGSPATQIPGPRPETVGLNKGP